MQSFGPPLKLGLTSLAQDDWLKAQPGDAGLLEARRAIVAQHRQAVIAEREEAAAAVRELANSLVQLGRIAGECPATDIMPWLAVRIAEDLCILTKDAVGQLRLTAATVCFPNRWRMSEKIGATMLETHSPVPDYADGIGVTVDRFLDRLRPGRFYARSNWGVVGSTELFTPDPTPPIDPLGLGPAFIRREDQTFARLPQSEAIVFSIRTSFVAVADLSPEERHDLTDWLAPLSADWRRYKSIGPATA